MEVTVRLSKWSWTRTPLLARVTESPVAAPLQGPAGADARCDDALCQHILEQVEMLGAWLWEDGVREEAHDWWCSE